MIAVADTGPLLYLSLVGEINLLPQLFTEIVIPFEVADELSQPSTPKSASNLISNPPSWLEIRSATLSNQRLKHLERGEQAAIELAASSCADVFLTDDAAAKTTARQTMNLTVFGTLGVLYGAALEEHIDFPATSFDKAITQLLSTNFYAAANLRKSIERLSRKLHSIKNSAGSGS